MKTVGTFEAKTHLSELLDQVEQGEEFLITRRGVAVARLVPTDEARRERVGRAIDELMEFRKGKTLGGLKIKDLIAEGRE